MLRDQVMKRIQRLGIFFVGIIISGWLLESCSSADSKSIYMGELESLNLLTLDSTRFQLTESQLKESLLLVVFNPTCDHCQAEAREIKSKIEKLKDVTILMIASVQLKEIYNFSVDYEMSDLENVKFVYTSPLYGYQFFGGIQLPHLRLYDREFKLIKSFSGATSVEDIISQIKR